LQSKSIHSSSIKSAIIEIQEIRSALKKPVIVNSGYRSPGYNTGIHGSAKWSRHMYGDAIDFYVKGESFDSLAQLCLQYGASFYQIYSAHIHCDWRTLPLNSEYYPGPKVVPQFYKIKALAERTSKIEIFQHDGLDSARVRSDFIEDDANELVYQWTLVDSGGHSFFSHSAEFILPSAARPPLHLELNIGGSIQLEKDLQFK